MAQPALDRGMMQRNKALDGAVEKRWSSIERAWDETTMYMPNETSMWGLEVPLLAAEAMLKTIIQTTEHMVRSSPGGMRAMVPKTAGAKSYIDPTATLEDEYRGAQ